MGHILGDPTTPLKVTSVLKPFLPPPCFSCPCWFSLSKPPALHTPPAPRAPRPSAVLCPPACPLLLGARMQGTGLGPGHCLPRPLAITDICSQPPCPLAGNQSSTSCLLPPMLEEPSPRPGVRGGSGLSLMGQHCPRQCPRDWFRKAGPWRLLNIFSTIQIWAPCRRSINNR